MSSTNEQQETNVLQLVEAQTIAEIKAFMVESRKYFASVMEMNEMLRTIARAQATMSIAAQNMSDTFAKSEDRQASFDEKYKEMIGLAVGKDQIPIVSHNRILNKLLLSTLIPTLVLAFGIVLGVMYIVKYDVSASLTSIEAKQSRTEELIKKSTQAIQDNDNENLEHKNNGG